MTNLPLALNPPSTRFHIRPVTTQDAEPLQQSCWTNRSTAGILHLINRAQQNARRKRGLGAVIYDPQANTTFAFGQLILWSECGEISDLIVAEAHRRQGMATAIIQYLVQYAKEINLPCVEIGVALSNPNALRLYRQLGFKDNYTLSLDIGSGTEPILYLKLPL